MKWSSPNSRPQVDASNVDVLNLRHAKRDMQNSDGVFCRMQNAQMVQNWLMRFAVLYAENDG